MLTLRRAGVASASLVSLLSLAGCGAPATNGFSLTASPAAVNLAPGAGITITLAAAAVVAGHAPVTAAVVLYNLPAGVTVTPASPSVTTGAQTTVTLTALDSAVTAVNPVQITGYAGLSSSSAHVMVAVVAPN